MKTLLRRAPIGARLVHSSSRRFAVPLQRVRQVRALFVSVIGGALSNQRKEILNFNDFWKWLCKSQRIIQNLGGRNYKGKPRHFKIKATNNSGTCTPLATGNASSFTQNHAMEVWNRYQKLPNNQKIMPNRYVDGYEPYNLNPCPNQKCCPYIAAAIHDFFLHKP